MRVLFQLNNKRSRNYEKAERIKNAHQVIFQDTWLVDAIAFVSITLFMIIINVADPSSNLANMNFIMRLLFIIASVAFVHNLFRYIFRPNATYRKICDSINFPIIVNSIRSGRSANEKELYPDIHINYTILDDRESQMAVLIQKANELILLDYINAPDKAERLIMTIEAHELEATSRKANMESGSEIRFLIARIKPSCIYAPNDTVNVKDVDDSIIVYDRVSPVEHIQ